MSTRPLHPQPDGRMIEGEHTYETIQEKIEPIVLSGKPPLAWFIIFGLSFVLVNVLLISIGYLLLQGIGIWGTTSRSPGPSTSSTSCGGSASATQAR